MQEFAKDNFTELGLVSNSTWRQDPRRLVFALSRYKFVSKMLREHTKVLEVGCGDGWNAKIVSSEVKHLTLTDYDPMFINNAKKNTCTWEEPAECIVHDFVNGGPLKDNYFSAAYSLDVLEHIDKKDENQFISNIKASCAKKAIVIFGMPSIESQVHIREEKRDPGHINCKSLYELQELMLNHFTYVLPFSMNDEVLHTGHAPMSNYIFSVCFK